MFDAQVGALQDVKSELTKLRGVLFYKVLEDLHAHLYNKGDYRYYLFRSLLFCYLTELPNYDGKLEAECLDIAKFCLNCYVPWC